MKIDISNDEKSSFWLSFAGLMTGLFFVFVLIVGMVVIRYSILASELVYLQKDLNENIAALNAANKELNKKHDSIKSFIAKLKSSPDNIDIEKYYNNLNLELSKSSAVINSSLDVISLKNDELITQIDSQDEEISNLKIEIEQKDSEIEILQKDIETTRKNLEDYAKIRENIALDLKNKLGNMAQIDLKSADVSMSATKIFNINSTAIRDDAKFDLRRIFKVYLDYILSPDIIENISNITIECHTDSDGGYLHNLDLSQKRALEIMKFAYATYKDSNLSKYMIAVGKSNSQIVLKDGVEDPVASFRINIKFDLKDSKYFIDKALSQRAN